MSKNYSYKDIIESQLPHKVYKNDDIESNILGRIFDNLQKSTDELELNINPYTSLEEGILSWEKFLKIIVKKNDTLEVRRNRVLAAFLQYLGDESVITKEEMESILKLYGGDLEVLEIPSEYTFHVNYKNIDEFNDVYINKIIKEIKPSYVKYFISFIRNNSIKIEEEHRILNIIYPITNEAKTRDKLVHSDASNVTLDEQYKGIMYKFEKCGEVKSKTTSTDIIKENIIIKDE